MVDEITAAASVLSTGLQFPQATALNDKFRVTCHMEIHNLTRFVLSDPYIKAVGGTVVEPPTNIAPGQRGAVVTRKTNMSLHGSYGTVSWIMGGNRLVLTWDAPYELITKKNSLGVGISKGHARDDNWHETMTTKSKSWFRRQEFGDTAGTLIHRDSDFEIHANMGATHHTIIKVAVYPCHEGDIAPAVREEMRRQAQKQQN